MADSVLKRASRTKVAFGEVVRLSRTRSNNPAADGLQRYVGLSHLSPGDPKIRRWGEVADGTTFTNVFRPGQVLFGKRRPYLRKVAVTDFGGVCSGDIYVLEPRDPDALLPELLPFVCQTDTFFAHAISTSAGSLSPRTNWKSLSEYEFALPTLREQRRIAAVLTRVARAEEAIRSAVEVTRSLRAAHLDRFFRSRMQRALPLREAADIVAGSTPSKAKGELWGGGRPWASGKDLKTRYLDGTEKTLTAQGWKLATIVPRGSTLVIVRGMILAHSFPVSRCNRDTAINQDLRGLISRDQLHPHYLFLWAEWAGRWLLRRTSISSHGTKRIEGEVLGRAPVPIATPREQKTLRSEGNAIAEGEGLLRDRAAELRALKYSLISTALGT